MIAIKGMDMPKDCIGCRIGYSVLNCPCNGSTLVFDYQDKRHPDCPLIEIVTCKDCKYWNNDGNKTTCDKNIGYGFPEDYFCGNGERKK